MMRKILEDATGVVTGSIYSNSVYVNFQLMFNGFKGEGRHDNSAWLLKSHFPVQWPGSHTFSASRSLVCVRNPIDIIASYINLMITSCHSINIDNDVHIEFPEFWTWYIEQQTDQYVKFYQYWIDQAKEKNIPTFFYRFEDTLNDAKSVA